MSVYGLADCNNFFVSCERVFRPALEGRPAVVLSSNDGCIVARSGEAKALDVKMAQPAFQAKDLIERHSVAVISGNHQFYTDMSNRVMQVFGGHCHVNRRVAAKYYNDVLSGCRARTIPHIEGVSPKSFERGSVE